MYVKHLGADMKLHRARQALQQLEAAQTEYLHSDGIRLETAPAGDNTMWCKIRVSASPPIAISHLARTAIGSTREALDDLAVSLAIASRRAPRDTTFPIAASAQQYVVEEGRRLRHANHAARRAVRSVTPWKGADDLLWELQCLVDTSDPWEIRLGQVVRSAPTTLPSVLHVLQPVGQTTDVCRPLHDNSPLERDVGAAGGDPATALEANVRLVLVAGALSPGRPVVDAIDLLITHTAVVVDQVVRAAERRP